MSPARPFGPAAPSGDGGPARLTSPPRDHTGPAGGTRIAAGLARVRLDLAYDGTGYAGWARQPGQRTLQADIEDALCKVLRLSAVRLVVAGRTDAGVHAHGQVAHVDLPADAPLGGLSRRLNGVLDRAVRVLGLGPAPVGFDARFSALSRRYVYRISNASYGAEPLRRHDTLAFPRPLDSGAMADAALALLGERDFAAFCRRREGATTTRTLLRLDVTRTGPLIVIDVEADAFCHSMVRSLVGALIAVGEGRKPATWPAALLARRVRDPGVTVAQPHGLTLVDVRYPTDDALGERAEITRARRTPLDS